MKFSDIFYDYNDAFQNYEWNESNQVKCSDYLCFTSDAYELK